jgi:hypothetical protein
MQVTQSDRYLSNHEACLLFSEALDFVQMTEELAAFDKLHKEIDAEVILENIVHAHDKRMLYCV